MNINLVFKFLKAFLGSFYDKGIGSIFWGFLHIFYNEGYRDAFVNYTDQFGAGEWAVAIIFIILIVAALVAIVWLIVFGIMKLIRINKNAVLPQDLVEECANLKKQIIKMSAEKDRILGMKVSDIGNYTGEEGEEGEEGASEEAVKAGESRFYKLTEIDQIYENYVPPVYDDEITLPELCDRFRLFACSRRKLFYDIRIIRLFIAGMSTTRLMILQGISGTGKTSLAHCMGLINVFAGKFIRFLTVGYPPTSKRLPCHFRRRKPISHTVYRFYRTDFFAVNHQRYGVFSRFARICYVTSIQRHIRSNYVGIKCERSLEIRVYVPTDKAIIVFCGVRRFAQGFTIYNLACCNGSTAIRLEGDCVAYVFIEGVAYVIVFERNNAVLSFRFNFRNAFCRFRQQHQRLAFECVSARQGNACQL